MSYTNTYLARHIDQSQGGMALTYTCRDCDSPIQDLMRLIHVVPNPTFGDVIGFDPETFEPIIDEQAHVPVFAKIVPCGKQWEDPEEYVDYDFQGHPFYHRILSADLHASWFGAFGCFNLHEQQICVEFNLRYDVSENLWISDPVGLVGGSLTFRVWGEFDGFDEFWFLAWTGDCGESILPASAEIHCFSPLRIAFRPDIGFGPTACCDAVSNPTNNGVINVWGLINPVYLGRLVDVHEDTPVYAIAECCNEACDTTFGCCDHVTTNNNSITYTLSNVDGLACGFADPPPCVNGPVVYDPANPPRADVTFICPDGPHPAPNVKVVLELVCRATENDAERGWQHYRLAVTVGGGGVIPYTEYEPSGGSCDPFFLLFEDVGWAVETTAGICSGVFDVTVLD